MIEVIRELCEHLDKALHIDGHKVEANTAGLMVRVFRHVGSDSTLERRKLVHWDELHMSRPMGVPATLVPEAQELERALFDTEAQVLVEVLAS